MGLRGLSAALLFASSVALAQSASVGQVTTTKLTVGGVRMEAPKSGAVKMGKIDVSEAKIAQPDIGKVATGEIKTAGPTAAKITFEAGGGAGGASGTLSAQEQALVDQASKDDLDWAKPGDDRRQLGNAAAGAENDAAGKAYAYAMDAGMDRNEAQRLAQAARQEVAKGPQPAAPAAAPTPAAIGLPETIDMSAPAATPATGAPDTVSTPPPGT